MRRAVVDASVVLKWFRPEVEGKEEALALWSEHRSGALALSAPHLLPLEIINSLGRRWKWAAEELRRVGATIDELAISFVEPELTSVATWVGRGLSAYDAAYVAVAEQERSPLVTADQRLLTIAKNVAVGLTDR
jgi:predicted nucleic acid-binding protein